MKIVIVGIVVLAVVVAVVFVLIQLRRNNQNAKPNTGTSVAPAIATGKNPTDTAARNSEPQETWSGLRDLILQLKPDEMGVAPGSPEPYGFVMEMGRATKNAKVTVVALRDGTMSLYLSTGGGVLGTGQRSTEAARVAQETVRKTSQYSSLLQKTSTFPVPETDRVRFFVLTGTGVLTAETNLSSLEAKTDPLAPLFLMGQDVLTQIRLASQ